MTFGANLDIKFKAKNKKSDDFVKSYISQKSQPQTCTEEREESEAEVSMDVDNNEFDEKFYIGNNLLPKPNMVINEGSDENKVGNLVNDHSKEKFKCEIDNCGKNFRRKCELQKTSNYYSSVKF